MSTSDKVGWLFLVLFLLLFVAGIGLMIADSNADGIANDECLAAGYDAGYVHMWSGDVFCTNTQTQVYSFPAGIPVKPLEALP